MIENIDDNTATSNIITNICNIDDEKYQMDYYNGKMQIKDSDFIDIELIDIEQQDIDIEQQDLDIKHADINIIDIKNDELNLNKSTSKILLIDSDNGKNQSTTSTKKKNIQYQFNEIYLLTKSLSQGSLHTLLLSIFETIFFWLYITKIEKKAIIKKLEYVSIIMSTLCSSVSNSDIAKKIDDIFEQEKYHKKLDNTSPFHISIILILVLSFITIFTNYLTKLLHLINQDYQIVTKNDTHLKFIFHELRNSMPLFLLICIYESLFFQLVVKSYEPITTKEFTYKILKLCF